MKTHYQSARLLKRLVSSGGLLVLSCRLLAAESGPVAAVQEALKNEQCLFGEISGVLDEPTRAALRRFQIRRSLPATGEIDTATMQVLQNRADAAPKTVLARPAESHEPGPTTATVEKDREFLQKVETGRDRPASDSPLTSPPPPAPPTLAVLAQEMRPSAPVHMPPQPTERSERPSSPDRAEPAAVAKPAAVEIVRSTSEAPKPEVARSRSNEESRNGTTRKIQRAPTVQSGNAPIRQEPAPETIATAPTRRIAPRISAGTAQIENDNDSDTLGSHGVRIVRSTTTATTGADGRIYTYETKTTTYPDSPASMVRRAEPVEPRRKDNGFFHRLFRGNKEE